MNIAAASTRGRHRARHRSGVQRERDACERLSGQSPRLIEPLPRSRRCVPEDRVRSSDAAKRVLDAQRARLVNRMPLAGVRDLGKWKDEGRTVMSPMQKPLQRASFVCVIEP